MSDIFRQHTWVCTALGNVSWIVVRLRANDDRYGVVARDEVHRHLPAYPTIVYEILTLNGLLSGGVVLDSQPDHVELHPDQLI